jgi:hypothetical protein
MADVSTFYNTIMKGTPLLYKYQFTVELIGSVAGFDNSVDGNVAYWAQSASIPAIEVVKAKTAFFGTEFRVPTTVKYEHDWTLKFLLDRDMTIYEKMRTWSRTFSDLRNSGGGTKTLPDVNMRINLLNPTQTSVTQSFVLVGCWPTNVGELKLEYKQDDTTPMTFDCKIKYQYCYDSTDGSSGDPLGTV